MSMFPNSSTHPVIVTDNIVGRVISSTTNEYNSFVYTVDLALPEGMMLAEGLTRQSPVQEGVKLLPHPNDTLVFGSRVNGVLYLDFKEYGETVVCGEP